MPLGQIESFDPKCHIWTQYYERLKFYFNANDITDKEKQRSVFFALCGGETFSLVHSLVAPKKLEDTGFDVIVNKLHEHFEPKENVIVKRFQFRKRVQKHGETLTQFVADLRKLAEGCNFNDLEVELRDQLVVGIMDELLQKKLLTDSNLTLKSALDMAIATEATNAQFTQMKNTVFKAEVIKNKPKTVQKVGNERGKACWRCNNMTHSAEKCWAVGLECRYCLKKGHIEQVCLRKKKHIPRVIKNTNSQNLLEVSDSLQELNYVFCGGQPITVTVMINGITVSMQVDTGCSHTIINEAVFRRIDKHRMLQQSHLRLSTWTNEQVKILGECDVQVIFKNKTYQLPVLVGSGSGTSLLGRNWMEQFGISMTGINQLRGTETSISEILNSYQDVFDGSLQGHTGPPVKIDLNDNIQPKFLKYRMVPFALKKKVEQELDKLVEQGILTPVQHSRWATPIVTVVKPNKEVRICGDYRSTVNKAVLPSAYPLPTMAEMRACFTGGTVYSKIDLKQAYQQLRVDDKTAELLTLNTTKGLFRVNQLQYGVSSCPMIFQQFMDNLLNGIQGVQAYLDDVIICGKNITEHNNKLKLVLKRIADAGLKINKEKCAFGQQSIKCLGFLIDKNGWHPTLEKVKAVREAPQPQNKTELLSFIGLLTFYDCFLKGRATVLKPLYELSSSKKPFLWTTEHTKAFNQAKNLLTSEAVVAHYNPELPLILCTDASATGVGAVLSNVREDGIEVPIAFASKTLSKTEQNYSVLDREGAAVIFAIKHFHAYLYGRQFSIMTDHKPLVGLFNPDKQMPRMLSPRMLRWCLIMSNYNYSITYRQVIKTGMLTCSVDYRLRK